MHSQVVALLSNYETVFTLIRTDFEDFRVWPLTQRLLAIK